MITRWTRDLNRPFIKKDTQMANKYTRRCSTSLAIRERQTETMMGYHCASIRMAGIKNIDKPTKTGADQNVLSPKLLAIGMKTRWHRTPWRDVELLGERSLIRRATQCESITPWITSSAKEKMHLFNADLVVKL